MLRLRRNVVAGEVGWEDDRPGGDGVINAGYNRVGIEGGEWCRVGWARGRGQRVSGGEGDIFVARKERRKGFKRSVVIARASLTMINGGEWHCRMQ
jgi:hypothetical protein